MQKLHVDLEEREAQIIAKEEEIKQRDAEISRLMEELRRFQEVISRPRLKLAMFFFLIACDCYVAIA